jgi:hypothetical protein
MSKLDGRRITEAAQAKNVGTSTARHNAELDTTGVASTVQPTYTVSELEAGN